MPANRSQRRYRGGWMLAAPVLAVCALPAVAAPRPALFTGRTERASVGGTRTQARGDDFGPTSVYYPAISANGRYVAFTSDALGLSKPCSELQKQALGTQVYVRDLSRQTTEIVSVRRDGCPGRGGGVGPVSLSADGRYVAFVSAADDLVPGFRPGAGKTAVYLRDRLLRRTVAVSAGYNGKGNNDDAGDPSISADGRYVAFDSLASNLVRGDARPPGVSLPDVYLRDVTTGKTTRVGPPHGHSRLARAQPSLSASGRYVAFASAERLVGTPDYGDLVLHKDWGEAGPTQVYVYDRGTGRIDLASRSDDGLTGNHDSDPGPSGRTISADGRYVVFASKANNLAPPNDGPWREVQPDLTQDIYLYDRTTRHLARVSVGPAGTPANYGSTWPSISANGRWVAFHTGATNLGDVDATVPVTDYLPVPMDAGYDVYVRDLTAGTNRLVSRSTDGVQGDLSSYNAVLSGDGRTVAFVSDAANLVADDTNGQADVFAYHAS